MSYKQPPNTATMSELAEHFKVSRPTIHRLMLSEVITPSGKMPGQRGAWLFPRATSIRKLARVINVCPTCGQLQRNSSGNVTRSTR